jgi:uncharacterized protein (TIGR02452 family)
MNREELIEIYNDTKRVCDAFEKPKSQKVKFSSIPIIESNIKTSNIIIEPLDTVSALFKYCSKKTAVLNMASAKHKGGGVERGTVAQEECLFRCSNLFTIPELYYPILPDELIYTKYAIFVKDVYYNLHYPVFADVITAPSINLNFSTKEDNYKNDILSRIEAIINIAI